MSKKTAPNKLRKMWRHARQAQQVNALLAIAALEGIDVRRVKHSKDSLQAYLLGERTIRHDILLAAVGKARRDFEANNPRPAGQEK